jgi:hypothetical protein
MGNTYLNPIPELNSIYSSKTEEMLERRPMQDTT